MFRLAEDDRADAEFSPSRGSKVHWIFTLACAAYNWCACETWRPQFRSRKSGPTCVSSSIELDTRGHEKHRESNRSTSSTMSNRKKNTLQINFSAACRDYRQ